MGAGSQNWPDYNGFISQCWGSPSFEGDPGWCALGAASNVVVGTNPPYSITDFYGFFPKYAGKIVTVTGTFSSGSATVTGINTAGLAAGQYAAILGTSPAIPSGTTISQITTLNTNGSLTLSQPANAAGAFPLTVYVGPPIVPAQVLNAYIALASASLVQARWCDTWWIAISWFCDHYLTLYARSNGNCSSGCGQSAAAGLKQGITVAVSAGGVSQSLQPVPGLEDWSAWNQSQSGVLLATIAKSMGAGCLWLY
jgi:hypothetical protein